MNERVNNGSRRGGVARIKDAASDRLGFEFLFACVQNRLDNAFLTGLW